MITWDVQTIIAMKRVCVCMCWGGESGKKMDGWVDGEMEECRE